MTALTEIAADDWDPLLARLGIGDVYFRRSYLESGALLDEGRPVLLHLAGPGGDVVFPCLVRAGNGSEDVATPMGYGGPVASGDEPPVADFFDAYERWCAESGIVSTFVRFHPVLGNHRLAEDRWHLERTGSTIGWRLETKGADELLAGMDSHHRRVVRKARRAGVRVDVVEQPGELDRFAALYVETMQRRDAAGYYFFPDSYWRLLVSDLREGLVRIDAFADDETVASAVCLASSPLLHYHLGASSARGRSLGANHLLFAETASWAVERGFTCFHLGGGVGGFEDSLHEFKRRFDPGGQLPAVVGKAVHDPAAYRALSGADEIEYAGFFPAYRRPR